MLNFITSHSQGAIWLAVLAAILLVLWLAPRRVGLWQPRLLKHLARRDLLHGEERQVFALLQAALPGRLVFPQVAVRALLRDRALPAAADRQALRAMIGSKHIDFTICHPDTMRVIALVEYDGRGHDAPWQRQQDQRRDALLAAAGYPVIRLRSRPKPTVAGIRAAFAGLL